MTWDPIADPVDHILLVGKKSPGIAEVVGASKTSKLKKLEPHYSSKGFVVFRGIANAAFSVKLRLYSAQDWVDWHTWKPLVLNPPSRNTDGLSIWHPLLEDLGVRSVLVENVSQPEQTGNGEWTITINFFEFEKPKRQAKAVESAKTRPKPDSVDLVLDQLTNQINALAGPRPAPLPVRR